MIVYLGDGVLTSGARNLDALRAKLAGTARFVAVGLGDGPDIPDHRSSAPVPDPTSKTSSATWARASGLWMAVRGR